MRKICTSWPASANASPCTKGNDALVGSSEPHALFIMIFSFCVFAGPAACALAAPNPKKGTTASHGKSCRLFIFPPMDCNNRRQNRGPSNSQKYRNCRMRSNPRDTDRDRQGSQCRGARAFHNSSRLRRVRRCSYPRNTRRPLPEASSGKLRHKPVRAWLELQATKNNREYLAPLTRCHSSHNNARLLPNLHPPGRWDLHHLHRHVSSR